LTDIPPAALTVAAGSDLEGTEGPLGRALSFFEQLGVARLVGLVAALAAVLLSLGIIFTRLMTPDYEELFRGLSAEDSAAIIRRLDTANEGYRLSDGGSTILIDRAKVMQWRITLAEQKLPSRGGVGYELFDKGDQLSTTSSLFQLNQVRALEGEISRSIASIAGVEAARVHLVVPIRELFSQQAPETRASVVVQFKSGAEAGAKKIEAIKQLVASAVKNLASSRVSIVDTRGTLLARGDGETAEGVSTGLLEQKYEHERRLRGAVERLLEQYVGLGRVRADVTVELNLASVLRTSELYDPRSAAQRSVQTVEEAGNKNEARAEPDVSVQQNTPDGRNAGTGTRNQESSRRTEETTNFEISKTSVRESMEPGTVKRVSVAVLVDGVRGGKGDANAYRERTPEEMQALEKLVKSAVGFSADRQDVVEVINLPFAEPELPDVRPPGLFDFTKNDIVTLSETAALLLGLALVLFVVVRPMLRALTGEDKEEEVTLIVDESAGKPPAVVEGQVDEVAQMKEEIEREMQELQAKRAEALAEMIDVDKIEGQVQASAIKRITEIVDKHPEEAAQVIRNWLTQRS
jgi:flagellar M-ring protein FliF